MRTTIFLLFTCVFISVAETGYTQNAKVTLNKNSVELKEVLNEIENQTDYLFIYNNKVNTNKTVSVKTKNGTVKTVLAHVLKDSDIDFTMEGNHIILSFIEKQLNEKNEEKTETAQQQQGRTITGTIVDAQGEPIIGANIIEKGTSNGTITDYDGNFSLNVANNAVLRISYIGYLEQEVATEGMNTINVTLVEDTKTLDELVVVGYASQKKINLTGSIASVNTDDILSTDSNIASQLQGRLPGVTITRDNSPGGDASVRLRGYGSINNNDPLYVIDGIPTKGGLNKINSNNVESITVLKDAAASSIYGSRAANGVIIVTTKRGSKGEPKINVSSQFGIQRATNQMDLLNTREYGELLWLEFKNQGLSPGDIGWGHLQYGYGSEPVIPDYIFPAGKMMGEVDEEAYNYPDPYYGITKANKEGTNWYDEIFVLAPLHEHNLSVSGGSDKSNYYFSLGYKNQDGIIDHTGFKSLSALGNGDFEITNWLKIGQSVNFTNTERGGISYNTEEGPVAQAYRAQPMIPVYDIAGNFAGSKSPTMGNASNPVSVLIRNKDNSSNETRVLANAFAEINLLNTLTFKSLIGLDYNRNISTNYSLKDPEFSEANTVDQLTKNYSGGLQYNWSNTLNFNKTFNKIHSLNILLGSEVIEYDWDWMYGGRSTYAFTNKDYMVLDAGEAGQRSGGSFDAWSTVSYFGRLNYILLDRYLLEGVFRRDASSRFSELNRWGTFPAFSAGWIISEEVFMKDVNWLDLLKLRIGYGQNGNDNVGNYNIYSTFRSDGYRSYYNIIGEGNSNSQAGFHKYSLGNPEAKWETTTTTNIGFDFSGFNNKFGFTLDLYNRKTTDMLYPETRPSTSGIVAFPSVNIGEMQNKGWDLSLSYSDSFSKDFKYKVSGNLSHYSNKVVSLNDKTDEILYGSTIRNAYFTVSKSGEPISSFYGYVAEGIFNTLEEVDNWPKYNPDANGKDSYSAPGVLRYKDVNGDGVITADDRTIIGSPHPDLTYGLSLDLQYKNWDLTAFFQGVMGNDLINYGKRVTDFKHFNNNRSKARLHESWTQERYAKGEKISLPVALDGQQDVDMQKPSSFFIEDGSYFRMKDLQLGFTLPKKVTEKINFDNVRIYLQGTNLFTVSKYSGLDPEINQSSDRHMGVDVGIYPTSQMFILGVNLNF